MNQWKWEGGYDKIFTDVTLPYVLADYTIIITIILLIIPDLKILRALRVQRNTF
jgi:hypothetical protein